MSFPSPQCKKKPWLSSTFTKVKSFQGQGPFSPFAKLWMIGPALAQKKPKKPQNGISWKMHIRMWRGRLRLSKIIWSWIQNDKDNKRRPTRENQLTKTNLNQAGSSLFKMIGRHPSLCSELKLPDICDFQAATEERIDSHWSACNLQFISCALVVMGGAQIYICET